MRDVGSSGTKDAETAEHGGDAVNGKQQAPKEDDTIEGNMETESNSDKKYELPKVCDDDVGHTEWSNRTLALYAEKFEQSVLDDRLENQFKVHPISENLFLKYLKIN